MSIDDAEHEFTFISSGGVRMELSGVAPEDFRNVADICAALIRLHGSWAVLAMNYANDEVMIKRDAQ